MNTNLTTERLTIRPVQTGDASFMLALLNTEGWLQFIGDRQIRTMEAAEQYIQRILNTPAFFYNVFALKVTGQPMGIISFLHRANQQHPDLGFAILPAFAGKGYAHEAARCYLDEVIRCKVHSKITGITLPNNMRSIQLLEKLGFRLSHTFEEEGKTLCLYALDLLPAPSSL